MLELGGLVKAWLTAGDPCHPTKLLMVHRTSRLLFSNGKWSLDGIVTTWNTARLFFFFWQCQACNPGPCTHQASNLRWATPPTLISDIVFSFRCLFHKGKDLFSPTHYDIQCLGRILAHGSHLLNGCWIMGGRVEVQRLSDPPKVTDSPHRRMGHIASDRSGPLCAAHPTSSK